jgi:hypothetical protein
MILSRTSRNWWTDPVHVIHKSMRIYVSYNKYALNNPQNRQNIEKTFKKPYKRRFCHTRNVIGALTLYMWYPNRCVWTSATINMNLLIHKDVKILKKNLNKPYKWRFCHARHVIGALTLYMWYTNRCILTSATRNMRSTTHKNIKKVEFVSKITWKSDVFVTHVTKLPRTESQKLISSSQ